MHDENREENLKENVAVGNPRKGDRPFFPPGLIAVLLDGLSERRTTLVYRKYSGQDNQCSTQWKGWGVIPSRTKVYGGFPDYLHVLWQGVNGFIFCICCRSICSLE